MKRLGWLVWLILLLGCGNATLLRDDFSQVNNDRWFTETDTFGQSTIYEGKLYIELNQANTIQYATIREPLFDNFDIEVDATLLSGSPTSSYGILFRKQETGGFYRFEVTGNGDYIIERRDPNGVWTRLLPDNRWQKSEFIHKGIGVTNRIGVIANGSVAIFKVNGEPVHRIDNFDGSFSRGSIALEAGTYAQPNVQVAFDDLVISEP